METTLRKVKAVGGVEAAALASRFPLNPAGIVSGPNNEFEIEGHPVPKSDPKPQTTLRVISPEYFDAVRQPLVKGGSISQA